MVVLWRSKDVQNVRLPRLRNLVSAIKKRLCRLCHSGLAIQVSCHSGLTLSLCKAWLEKQQEPCSPVLEADVTVIAI